MRELSTHVASSMQELGPWRDQWNALADKQQLPLVRFEWFVAVEAHLASKDRVRVVYVVDAAGELAGAAALELRRNKGCHAEYEILGMSRLYEPSALLYRDDGARRRLLRALALLDLPVVLARLWPGSVTDHVRLRFSRHAIWLRKESAPSQLLRLTDDYPGYMAQLPAQRRYDLRRAYKRAEALGALAVDFIRPTSMELEEPLRLALEVESRSWKGARESAVLANTDLQGFFFDMLRSYTRDGSVLIALLRVGAAPVAAQICLLAYQRLWILKIGYDATFGKASPGLILMNEVVKRSFQLGLRGIEFLGSAEDWVDAWRPSLRDYALVAAYPYTVKSLVALAPVVASAVARGMPRRQPGAA